MPNGILTSLARRMTEQIADRFSRLMSRLQDMTLLVLKGHLLIEEQLEYFLEQAARAPRQLMDARLTYAQKLQLVRALCGMSGEEFDFAKAISAIRNSLAHRADADELPSRIDALLRQFNKEVPQKLTPRQRAAWLRTQLAGVCGTLRGISDGFHAAVRTTEGHPRLRRPALPRRR